jgi:hypothetical protein
MYRERSVKNLACKKFGFSMKENLYRPLLICYSRGKILLILKSHAMKEYAYSEREVRLHALLTSALDTGEWLSSRSVALSLGNDPPVSVGFEALWAPVPLWK